MITKNVLNNRLFNKGCKVPIRGKINEPLHTGLRVVDSILPIGKGQRQLIIGDRFTGKTSIYLNSVITQNRTNCIFGNKRLIGVYVAINQNQSRIEKVISILTKRNVK